MASSNRHSAHPDSRIMIRIPTRLWNAYQPQSRSWNGFVSTPATRSPQTKNCKVKLSTFHHGGAKRVTRGPLRNEITYEAPCLEPMCASCWRWHPHLMRSQTLPEEASHHPEPDLSQPQTQSEPELPSREIDPRILDDRWRFDQSRPGRAASMHTGSAQTLPSVDKPFINHNPSALDSDSTPLTHTYNIFLPTALVDQTVSARPVETKCRDPLRERCIARLVFVSQEGKVKFKELLRRREKKAMKREYDKARYVEKGRARVSRLSSGWQSS